MTLKRFVLDTNVLLHDPASLLGFKHHTIVISLTVLEELDAIKSQERSVSADARQVIRLLSKLIGDETDLCGKGVVRNAEGGVLIVPTIEQNDATLEKFAAGSNDKRIIRDALFLQRSDLNYRGKDFSDHDIPSDERKYSETIFVSNDINAQVIARAAGLKAEVYRDSQIVEEGDDLSTGFAYVDQSELWEMNPSCSAEKVYAFEEEGLTKVLGMEPYPNLVVVINDDEFLIVRDISDGEVKLSHHRMSGSPKPFGAEPRSIEQAAAIELLEDPDIPCVVITGEAGSGKTYLTINTGMEHTGLNEDKDYNKIIASRTTADLDEDIGFLPGTEEEKMGPWMEAIVDNIEAMMEDCEHMESALHLAQRHIQYRSINFMRGRSIQNSFFILDEGQNLTPHQIKTMITRIGEGSKMVVLGDLSQIDNKFLSAYSSGLTYVIERMKESKAVAHIQLKGSERSFLAQEANRLL